MNKYDEKQVVKMVATCLNDAAEGRREQCKIPSPFMGEVGMYLDDPWPVYREFYDGDPWKRQGKQASWKSLPSNNFGFIVVESNTTKLTDNRPKVQFVPRSQEHSDLARRLNAGFDYWWEQETAAATDTLAVKDSRLYSVGWLHPYRDDKAKKQRLSVVHPENIYLDPDCTAESFFRDGPAYLIHEYTASVADILDRYPDVKLDDLKTNWLEPSFFDRVLPFFQLGRAVKNPASTIAVYDMWMRDSSMKVWEEEFGEEIIKKRGLRYPHGRVITVAGGQVLRDIANPYDHGQFPFVPIHCYPKSGQFYGSSDMSNLLPSIVMYNRYDQMTFDQIQKSGGGIILTNKRYGLYAEDITNALMQTHEVTDVNQALRVERFPEPSRAAINHQESLRSAMQDMAGMHDQSMGRYTPGEKTGQEVSVISESDNTRIRLAAKWHSWALTRVGEQWLSNARQWGDFKWLLTIAGDDGEVKAETLSGKDLRNVEFDISVADFAMLPDTYQERKQQALALFDRQAIDAEELLKTLEWPNYKTVLARITKQQEEMLAAQQQASTPPAPVAGNAPVVPMEQQGGMGQQLPPELMAMMQGGAAPDMGAVPFDEPPIPDDADPMEIAQAIADMNGVPVEQVLAMLAEQGAV